VPAISSNWKRVLRRWTILLAIAAVVYAGYSLWPRLSTHPIPVLHLPADPYQAGLKIGKERCAQVEILVHEYYEQGLKRQGGPGNTRIRRAVARAKAVSPKAYALEIKGIAEGSGIPEDLVWEANLAVDLYSNTSLMACSSVVAPKSGGGFLVGRNLDFFDFGVLHENTTLLVRPREGGGWTASMGWPGMVGILTGWNDRGEFCSLNLALNDRGALDDPDALPGLFLVRRALELRMVPDEKAAWLEKQPPSFPMILCFAAPDGGRVIEKGASGNETFRSENGAAFADNGFRGSGQPMGDRCHLLSKMALHSPGGVRRRDVEAALGDVTLGTAYSGGFVTLYSVVFDVGTQEAWIASGILPATRAPYRRVTVVEP